MFKKGYKYLSFYPDISSKTSREKITKKIRKMGKNPPLEKKDFKKASALTGIKNYWISIKIKANNSSKKSTKSQSTLKRRHFCWQNSNKFLSLKQNSLKYSTLYSMPRKCIRICSKKCKNWQFQPRNLRKENYLLSSWDSRKQQKKWNRHRTSTVRM